ncbi:MAG: discoidin domain-containing protein [Bradyrhizobiaceae bacterium]|nr:discoidin domain-containing protein [Bradyrhizobiaceae bacterium]
MKPCRLRTSGRQQRGNVFAPAARQRGNVFAMLFAAVALTGVLAAVGMQTLTGPVSTITRVTQRNITDNNLLMNAKIIVNAAVTAVAGGDSDGDGIIEPAEFVPAASGETPPANGGFLPTDLGLSLTDPWGSKYGYCVWDHGTTNASANRLGGDNTSTASTQVVIAIIAAGPDKEFQTTCSAYSGGPVQVTKASGSDDLIFKYSYAEAAASSNGLWTINVSDQAIAELKDSAGSAVNVTIDRDTGIGDFLGLTTSVISAKTDQTIALDGGLLLDADGGGAGTCTAAEKGSLRLNTDRDDLELCDGAGGWVEVRTPPGGSAGHVQFNDGADGFAGDSNLFWDNSAKRLGIGGSPSTHTLDVTGTFGASGNATIGGTLGVAGAATLSSTLDVTDAATLSGTLSVSGNATFNTDTLFVDADSDRVGVGTASPAHLLDIAGSGDMGALGSFTVGDAVLHVDDGTAGLYIDGRTVVSDGALIVGTTGAETLQLVTDETQRILIASDGTVSITGNTGISGATSLWSTLSVAGIADFDSGTLYVDVPDSRVGVGTTDPLTKLDVAGGVKIGGDSICNISKAGMVAWNSGVLQLCGADGNWTSLAAIEKLDDIGDVDAASPSANEVLAWDGTNWVAKNIAMLGPATVNVAGNDGSVQFRDGNDLGADPDHFHWDKTNHRLGIGTDAPGADLDVNGNILLSGDQSVIRFKKYDGSNDNVLYYNNATADNTIYLGRDSNVIRLRTAGDIRFHIGASGYAGIGTTDPKSLLQVAGGIQLGDDTAACPGAGNIKLGTLRFNAGALQVCTATGWGSISSGGVSCPGGFTQIAAQGRVLGCMQTDENSAATWPTAASACFVNHGGRLPTSAEWYLAAANYSLSNETGNWEWLSDAVGETSNYDNHAVVGNTAITDFSWGYDTAAYAYRCFIPASSGGGGSGGGSGTAPAFSVNRNGVDQSVTASTEAKIDFTSKSFDVTGAFDLATDRFTPQTPGKYVFVAAAYCPSATNYCQVFIRKNGSYASVNFARGDGGSTSVQTSAVIDMNGTTDYVEASVLTAPGTTVNGAPYYTYFTGSLLGGLGGGSGGSGDGSSTSGTVVPGWPDAIRCAGSAGSVVLNFGWQNTAGTHTSYTLAGDYGTVNTNTPRLIFTSASSPATLESPGWNNWATDCDGKTIPELYASGQAFNFVGGGTGAGSGDVFWRSGIAYSVSGNHANCIAPTETLMNDDDVTGNMSWGSASASGAQWIRADLGGVKSVNRIKIGGPLQCPGWTSCSNSYYEGAELQISNDGSTWTTVKTFTAGDYSNSTLMTHSFPTENARYVRLYKNNSWMCTGQFRVGFQSGDTLAGLECASGEIPKWNGSAWECAIDGGGSGGATTIFSNASGALRYAVFNGVSGTVVYKSGGVSDVIRTGAGEYVVKWATPFADDNYVILGHCNPNGFSGAKFSVSGNRISGHQYEGVHPSQAGITCRKPADGSNSDSDLIIVVAFDVNSPYVDAGATFNGSGGATVYAQKGVSSISRTATGRYTVTWSTPFPDNKYVVLGSCNGWGTGGGGFTVEGNNISGDANENLKTTSVGIGCRNPSMTDSDLIHIVAVRLGEGFAKKGAVFNGSGSISNTAYSNVSSVTRVSTGVYDANWATPFPSEDYVFLGSCNALGTSGLVMGPRSKASNTTAAKTQFECRTGANANGDTNYGAIIGFDPTTDDIGDPVGGGGDTLASLSCNAGEIAKWNGSEWACAADGGGDSSGGNSMVPGWPDAVQCFNGSHNITLYMSNYSTGSSYVVYEAPQSGVGGTRYYLTYNIATGAYSTQASLDTYDCVTSAKSIATLYAEGKAFNFGGGGSGGPNSAFHVASTSTQALTSGWTNKVDWTNKVFDAGNEFDLANDRFVPASPGKYLLSATVRASSGNASIQATGIYKNGALINYAVGDTANNDAGPVTTLVEANGTTDYFEVYYYVSSAGGTLAGAANIVYFSGFKLGGGDTLAGLSCASGEIPKWSGSEWICAADGGGSGSGGSSMVPGWPDAFMCQVSGKPYIYWLVADNGTQMVYRLLRNTAGDSYIRFNPTTKAYIDTNDAGNAGDCAANSWSIADLYAQGRAFNFVGGGGGSSSGNNYLWSDAWQVTTNTDGGGNDGYSWRTVADVDSGGEYLRIRFVAPTNGPFNVNNAAIGIQSSGASTTSTPVELLFSGASGFSLAAGESVWSDPLPLSFSAADNLVIIFDIDTGNPRVANSGADGAYYKAATVSYDQASGSGFTLRGADDAGGIDRIQVSSAPLGLADLADVDVSALADGKVLGYNAATQKWEAVDAPAGGSGGGSTKGFIASGSTTSIPGQIAFSSTAKNDFGAGVWSGNTFTVPAGEDGWYVLSGYVASPSSSNSNIYLVINRNGTRIAAGRDINGTATSQHTHVNVSTTAYLEAGDEIELVGQNSNSSTAVSDALLSILKIGSGGDTLSGLSCSTGDIPKWSGSEWACAADGGGGSTMLPGWPDAIVCSNGSASRTLYYSFVNSTATGYRHATGSGSDRYVRFDPATKEYLDNVDMAGWDCVTNAWSIADLYAQDRAFNFTGGGGSGGTGNITTAVKTDTYNFTNGTTWTDIPGMSVTITPGSAGSKVLVTPSISVGNTEADQTVMFRLMRDSTPIGLAATAGSRAVGTFSVRNPNTHRVETSTMLFVDAPGTTSAVTYKLQMRKTYSYSGTPKINTSGADSDADYTARTISTLTAMEVGGGGGKFVDGTDPDDAVYTDGNVGIGTTSPDSKLDVRSGAHASNQDIGINIGTPTGGSGWLAGLHLKSNGSGVPRLTLDAPSDGAFGMTEALSILNNGNVGIGTTSPGYTLDVSGNVRVNQIRAAMPTVTSTTVCRSANDGNGRFLIGDCPSLRKYKTEIRNLDFGLETVLKLRPVAFTWIPEKGGHEDFGFIAEEVEAVNPLLAEYNTGRLIGVKYHIMSSLLAKAVQELKADNDNLRGRIDAMDAELKAANDNYEELRREIGALKAAR